MFKIEEDGTIKLTRGDTADFGVYCILKVGDNKQKITLKEGDKVHFSVKISEYDSDSVIHKELTSANQESDGKIKIRLDASDTSGLEFMDYLYDIQANLAELNIVDTFVGPNIFSITKEITH